MFGQTVEMAVIFMTKLTQLLPVLLENEQNYSHFMVNEYFFIYKDVFGAGNVL